jgi:predicted enzyme related to lactoylglutathione lyase
VPYVEVADLDEAIQNATSLGATLSGARVDLPQGSVAVITDPTGAVLALWETR